MTATFVQAAKTEFVAATASVNATFGAGVTAGSFIVVAGDFDRATTGVTITNGSGNAVSIVDALVDNAAAGIKSYVQAFFAPTAGVTVVTATFSGTQPTFGDLYIWEFSGLSSPAADKVINNPATSGTTAVDSGSSGTLSTADQAAIGFGATNGNFTVAGAGWSTVAGDGITANTGSLGEHRTVAATTAINATATISGTGAERTMHLATFKAATAAAFGDLLGTLSAAFATSTNPESATGSVVVSIGDLVVVCVGEQTTLEVTGASDNLGNTYSAIAAGLDGGSEAVRGFYSRVSIAGTLTSVSAAGITVSANDSVVVAAVYKGPFTSSPLDIAATVANDATTPFSCPATGTLAQADEVVIGYGAVGTAAAVLTATSPMVMSIQAASSTLIRAAIAAKVVAATTTSTPAFAGTSANASWGTASFRKAALQALTPSLFANTNTFFTPVVGSGLVPALFADTDTFFAPVVGRGLVPALFADADTFFAPVVGAGALALTPSLFVDTDAFFAPTVAGGGGTTAATLAFQQAVSTSGGATSRTLSFTSVASAAGQDRLVALCSITSDWSNTTLSNVAIDGQAATQVGTYVRVWDEAATNGPLISFWRAAGTANTSINVTFDIAAGGVYDARGALWTLNAGTVFDFTATSGVSNVTAGNIDLSLDVDTITNGTVAAAFIAYNSATKTATWVGLTERYDGTADSLYGADWFSAADLDITSGSAPLTITADLPADFGFTSAAVGLAVSFNASASSAQTLTPSLFSDPDTFFAPTVAGGAVAVTPSLFIDTDAFFTASVFAGGGATATLAFQQAYTRPGGLDASWGTISLPLTCASAAGQDRIVALLAITSTWDTATFSNVTIDGQAATQIGTFARVFDLSSTNGPLASFWRAAGTANTSINVNFNIGAGAIYDTRAALWTLNNAGTLLDFTVSTGTSNVAVGNIDLSFNVDTIANGVAAAAFIAYNSSTKTATWIGLTERYDGTADSLYGADWFGVADLDITSGSAPLTITADLPADFGFTSAAAGLVVSFNPVASSDTTLTPSLYSDSDTFFAPTVSSLQALFPSLFAGATTVGLGAPLPFLMFTGDTVTGPSIFYSPTVQLSFAAGISPTLYSDDDTFFSPTVGRGAVTLTPALYADADGFFAPTIGRGSVNVAPSLYADADAFFSPTVGAGVVNLTPALYVDADTFFAPVVGAGAANIAPALYVDADVFFTPTLGGVGTLSPALYIDADTFFTPVVGAGAVSLTPALYTDSDTFFTQVALSSYPLQPSLYVDADAFASPIIAGGTATIQPNTFADPDTFFSATISTGPVSVAPSLYADADAFFTPIALSINPLSPALFSDADVFFTPVLSALNILLPDKFVDPDTFHTPIIGALGDRHLFPEHFIDDPDTFFVPHIRGGEMGVVPRREWYDAATPRSSITPSVPRSH